MTFYLPNSDKDYLISDYWEEERKFLSLDNSRLLNREEANRYNLSTFFTKEMNDEKPKLNTIYKYYCIPYELDDVITEKLKASNVILELLNDNLNHEIFLASTDNDKCCFVSCGDTFTENIMFTPCRTHTNTPFIVFDVYSRCFALIDYDLPLQIIGFRDVLIDSNSYLTNCYISEGWYTVFQRYSSYSNMPNLFKRYYYFLLPKMIQKKIKTIPNLIAFFNGDKKLINDYIRKL